MIDDYHFRTSHGNVADSGAWTRQCLRCGYEIPELAAGNCLCPECGRVAAPAPAISAALPSRAAVDQILYLLIGSFCGMIAMCVSQAMWWWWKAAEGRIGLVNVWISAGAVGAGVVMWCALCIRLRTGRRQVLERCLFACRFVVSALHITLLWLAQYVNVSTVRNGILYNENVFVVSEFIAIILVMMTIAYSASACSQVLSKYPRCITALASMNRTVVLHSWWLIPTAWLLFRGGCFFAIGSFAMMVAMLVYAAFGHFIAIAEVARTRDRFVREMPV